MIRTLVVMGLLLLPSFADAQRPPPREENTGPNTNIIRMAEGEYLYTAISDGRERGTEKFQLLVHPDESRTMIMWNDFYAKNGQLTAVLKVAPNFRPKEAYMSFWTEAGYKGSALYTVTGDKMTGTLAGPAGEMTQTIDVPAGFSVATHPLAGDGWHTWHYDKDQGGVQTAPFVNFDASADLTQLPISKWNPQEQEFLGVTQITVPAGTFMVDHFRQGTAELFIHGPDHILVKFLWEPIDRQYELVSLTQESFE